MDQKNQIDRILAVVEETNIRLSSIEGKVSTLSDQFTGLDNKVTGLDNKVTGLDRKVTSIAAEVSGLTDQVSGLLDLPEKVAGLTDQVTGLTDQVSGIAEQVAGLSEWRTSKDQHDEQVLGLLLDTRERVERLETGFGEVKEWKRETLDKLDGFLVVLDRHESEIAALRGGQQRVEERLGKG